MNKTQPFWCEGETKTEIESELSFRETARTSSTASIAAVKHGGGGIVTHTLEGDARDHPGLLYRDRKEQKRFRILKKKRILQENLRLLVGATTKALEKLNRDLSGATENI